jgi:hypothetical protein
MKLKVRKPNLEKLTDEGIPKDFSDVRDYFNQALKDNSLPWIPRKTPITNQEIKEKWIPSLNQNICYVAELNGDVVGSATVFYDTKSSNYENSSKRVSGESVSTTSPKVNYVETEKAMVEGILEELKNQNKKAHAYISIESPANIALNKLGYLGKEEFLERYKTEELSGKVMKYDLP